MKRTFTGFCVLAALVSFFAGSAAGLVLLVGWPLPGWTVLRAASELHYLPGHLVAQLAACVAWPCLAWLFVAVARMGVDAWNDRPSQPAGPLRWLQPLVRRAVAAMVVSAGLLSRTPAWSAPTLSTAVAAATTAGHPVSTSVTTRNHAAAAGPLGAVAHGRLVVTLRPPPPPAVDAARPASAASTEVAQTAATYRVRPGDSLWDIADTCLHDPLQWRAIWELNRGRVITDRDGGHRVFNDPKLILTGWELTMPPGWTPTTSLAAPAAPGLATPTPPSPAPGPVQAMTAPTLPAAPPASDMAVPPPVDPATSAPRAPGRGEAQRPASTSTTAAGDPTSINGSGSPANKGHAGPNGRQSQPNQPIPVGPIAGIGGVAAAGIIWTLSRRRREAALHRPTGTDIATSPPAVETAERQARAIADHEAMQWIDLGLRYLGGLFEHMAEPPAVVLVRAGSIGLEVMIEPPTIDPPGRFESIDDGVTWRLDPTVELSELEASAADRWPLLPALVTVGDTPVGTVLANLEHAGSLSVEGDPQRQRGLLAQMLVEMTSQPWTDQTLSGLHVLGDAGNVANLPGVDVDDDPDLLAQILDQASDRNQRDTGDAASVAARRAVDAGWEPHVTIAFPDAPTEALRCVIEAAIPDCSGVTVVAAGPVPGARWRLHVQPDGAATLSARSGDRPFEMQLRVDADPAQAALLAAALAGAAEPVDDIAIPAEDEGLLDDAVENRVREIAVLGNLTVIGGPGPDAVEPKRRRPGLAVLAYLATHRQPVSSQDLERALWPLDTTKPDLGGVSRSTVTNAVGHARRILGRGPNGEELLFFTPEGYRFAEGVTTNWARFQYLVAAAAESDDRDAQVEEWTAALRLVDGVPFAGSYPGKYFEWVGSERLIDKMTARIVDIAYRLATAALDAEKWDLVRWAVDCGLALAPAREELFQALMHAEGRAGKPDRVQEIYGQLCAMLQREIDVFQTPTDTSEAIRNTYTPQTAARR